MALKSFFTHAAARRTIIVGVVTVLAAFLLCDRLAAQAVTPVPIEGSERLPFSDSYNAIFGSRDMAFRLNYDTERYGQQNGQFGIGLQGHRGLGFGNGLWIFSGQYNVDFGQPERMGLDVGGGFRMLHSDFFGRGTTRIFGAQLWYDGLGTEINNYFNQMGFSLESLGDRWDFRVNGNFPIGEVTQQGAPVRTGEIGYYQQWIAEVTDIPVDEAITVVDFEAARRLGDYDIWLFGGGYGMDASGESCFGGKMGLRGWLGSDAMMELAVTQDDFFDTKVNFAVVWYPGRGPLYGPRTRCIEDRLRDPILRNDYIATRRLHEQGGIALTDSNGDPIRVVHVNSAATAPGDGTYDNPYTSLDSVYAGSQAGDIILVWSDSTYSDETVILRDRQRLLGEGTYTFAGTTVSKRHEISTGEFGTIDLPETRPGGLAGAIPVITNTTGDVVTLANAATTVNTEADNYNASRKISYNEVSNLAIEGGTRGIVSAANGIGEADINNVTVSDTTQNGIELTPFVLKKVNNVGTELSREILFTANIEKTQFDNVGTSGGGGTDYDDIYIDANTSEPDTTSYTESIAITNVRSTNAWGWGINVTGNKNAAAIEEYDFIAGLQSNGGIQFTSSPGGAAVSNTEIEGSTVSGSTGIGVNLVTNVDDAFDSSFTFNDVTITDMGTAGFQVSGGGTNVDFTGKINQSRNAPAVYVKPTQDPDTLLYSYHSGTLNFNEMTADDGVVYATAGTGLVFEDANGIYNFNSLVKLEDVATGIDISNTEADAGGMFTFSKVAINNPTTAGLKIDGGASAVSFTGLITHDTAGTGYAVDVSGGHTGTVTFSEKETDEGVINAVDGNGLRFTNADGTYLFNNRIYLHASGSLAPVAGISIIGNGSGDTSNGQFTFNNAIITDIAGVGFNLNGGAATVDFTGKITQNASAQAVVAISGYHTGTVTFNEKNSDEGIVEANQGSGLVFQDANGVYEFNHLIDLQDSAVSGEDLTTGIAISNSNANEGGLFTFDYVNIKNATDAALRINGGQSVVSLTGLISQDVDTAGYAVDIKGGHTGTLTFNEKNVDEGIIIASDGDGLNFSDADGTYTFNNMVSLTDGVGDVGVAGIDINTGSDGSFTFSNVAITSIEGVGFRLDSGTADVSFKGKITQKVNDVAVVSIGGGHKEGTGSGQGTGIVTFSEKVADAGVVEATRGTGMQFDDADGTYAFNNKIDLYRELVTNPNPPPAEIGQSPSYGINIVNGSDGGFTFSNVTITDINGVAFNLNGGTADVSFTGKITQEEYNQGVVTIGGGHKAGTGSDQGTGTVVFNEKIGGAGIIEATNGDGLQFNNADGTYTFNNKIDLSGAVGTKYVPFDPGPPPVPAVAGVAGIGISNGSDGTFTFKDVAIDSIEGIGLDVDGGQATVAFTGLITQASNDVAVVNVHGGHTGTLAMTEKETDEGVVTASTGPGLTFDEANGTYTLSNKITLSGDAGVAVSDSTGTFALGDSDSTITKSSGTAFSVDGGSATITYSGKINSTTGAGPTLSRPVDIQNVTGGTINFGGKITGSSQSILVQNNTGGSFNFNGQVQLDMTGSNNGIELIDNRDTVSNTSATTTFANLQITTVDGIGFKAASGINNAGSGIVQVTGNSNTISTTGSTGSGTAIYMDDAQIGTSGVRFSNVDVNKAVNGIYLNDVVGTGTLTVSDGTITNTTGDGVSITSGTSIYSSVTSNATVSLNSLEITNAAGAGVSLTHSNAKTFNVTVADSTISGTAGEGIALAASGSGAMHLTLNDNTVTQSAANVQAVALGISSGANKTYITMDGNSISQTAAAGTTQQALHLNAGAGTCYFEATNNSFSSQDTTQLGSVTEYGASFDVEAKGGTLNATIHDNTFNSGTPSVSSTTARGFRMAAMGGSVKLSLLDNVGSADSGAAPFLCYKNAGSSFGVELLKTPDATVITDKTPEVNVRNGGSGAYSDYDAPNTTPAEAGWVIEFLPDGAATLTPPMDLGFGNLSEGSVPTP